MALTLGVDLAAEPANTAACLIRWDGGGAEVVALEAGCADARLLELAEDADAIGLDCPLGWPDAFVRAVGDHAAGRPWPGLDAPEPRDYRRALTYRATDLAVIAAGLRPLSVSTDKLGVPAMRAALLLGHLARAGRDVARDGGGEVVEVYPAGALWRWGLPHRGYKNGPAAAGVREAILAGLRTGAPWLAPGDEVWASCARSDHMLDALVCALVTRAAARGLTEGPPPDRVEQARREGWIHLPAADGLAGLA